MNLVFCGTGTFGLPTLSSLLAGPHRLLAVVTQPDRRTGRARKRPRPIADLARGASLPLLEPERCNGLAFAHRLAELAPDLVVVVAYGQFIRRPLLDVPTHGWINLHASLLPLYRGAAPIPRAILDGRTRTGVSVFCIDPAMDAGDVLAQETLDILDDETAGEIELRLADVGARVLLHVLDDIAVGRAAPVAQDHAAATFAPAIEKHEGRIDWRDDARRIALQIRAFTPSPGARAVWRDPTGRSHPFLVRRARSVNRAGGSPGTVMSASHEGIAVACGQDALLMTELQPAGKKTMSAAAFLNGHRLAPGESLLDVAG